MTPGWAVDGEETPRWAAGGIALPRPGTMTPRTRLTSWFAFFLEISEDPGLDPSSLGTDLNSTRIRGQAGCGEGFRV